MTQLQEHSDRLRPSLASSAARGAWPLVAAIGVGLVMFFGVGPRIGDYPASVMALIGINVILAVSLTVVNGFTGQFSMGHAGFMAVGGYATATVVYYGSMTLWESAAAAGGVLSYSGAGDFDGPLVGKGDLLFLGGLFVGGCVAAVAGYLVGLPTLRLRGDYLAIVTLGFGEIVRVLLQGTRDQIPPWKADTLWQAPFGEQAREFAARAVAFLTHHQARFWALLAAAAAVWLLRRAKIDGRLRGALSLLAILAAIGVAAALPVEPRAPAKLDRVPLWDVPLMLGGPKGFNLLPIYTTLFWVYAGVVLTLVLVYRLKTSSTGRAFLSIREDEIAAQAMGIDVTKLKVRAFVLASFLAGMAGGLYGMYYNAINATELGFQKSFDIIIMVVLGGMGSISGAALAATLLTVLGELLRDPPPVWPAGLALLAAMAAAQGWRKQWRPVALLVVAVVTAALEAGRQLALAQGIKLADYRLVLYALMLILVMILRPEGLFGVNELWDYFGARRRRRIVGPLHAPEGVEP